MVASYTCHGHMSVFYSLAMNSISKRNYSCIHLCNFSMVCLPGPAVHSGGAQTNESSLPPGRRLVVPLHVCVCQGLSFVKARLLSMEIPAHISETLPKPVHVDESVVDNITSGESKTESLVKIDPYRGSWGLRLLELELSNPTDVVFEISVSMQLESSNTEDCLTFVDRDAADFGYPKTRIDRDYSARVLIPLEHFKLPILDDSFFMKDAQIDDAFGGKSSTSSEKNTKAELNASIKNLTSRIKVRWQSGRSSSGELNIRDAIQAALQTSVMDILLPDPLTFGFRLGRDGIKSVNVDSLDESNIQINGKSMSPKGFILAHEMTPIEVLVRNNTKDMIRMTLSVTCRDVAGENCVEGKKATVLWAGIF